MSQQICPTLWINRQEETENKVFFVAVCSFVQFLLSLCHIAGVTAKADVLTFPSWSYQAFISGRTLVSTPLLAGHTTPKQMCWDNSVFAVCYMRAAVGKSRTKSFSPVFVCNPLFCSTFVRTRIWRLSLHLQCWRGILYKGCLQASVSTNACIEKVFLALEGAVWRLIKTNVSNVNISWG